ncbi:MAG: LptE family protein [Bacteroidales bacterium]|nr:LptE family protein [Bacteroidales bacterium]
MRSKVKIAILLLALACIGHSCGIYSFSGASIPAEAKTVSVDYFPNHAQLVNPTLSNNFTNALRDAMTNQTTLDMVETGGDLAFEGEISDYKTMPVAITSGQTAAMNRLTVTVKVRFSNRIDDTKDFEQSFSRYEDYPSDQDLNSVQESLTATIIEALVEDIFNKALVNW